MITEDYSKKFVLFGNCKITKGYSRAIICDLYRFKYYYIPLELCEIIEQLKYKDVNTIIESYKDQKETIVEYLDYFIKMDLGIFTNDPLSFPPIKDEWLSPYKITTSIIDFNDKNVITLNHYKKFIEEISNLGCQLLELRFFFQVSKKYLLEIISLTNNTRIKNLNITLKYSTEILKGLEKLLINNKRIKILHFFSTKESKNYTYKDALIIFSTENNINESDCGNICKSKFLPNIEHYTEALNYNTCLNRKISVDSFGNLKNCPSDNRKFGNLNDSKSLQEIIEDEEFTKYWKIKKDDISECRDCEYRYICMDCRVFKRSQEILDKPLKCNYNPYKAEWIN